MIEFAYDIPSEDEKQKGKKTKKKSYKNCIDVDCSLSNGVKITTLWYLFFKIIEKIVSSSSEKAQY